MLKSASYTYTGIDLSPDVSRALSCSQPISEQQQEEEMREAALRLPRCILEGQRWVFKNSVCEILCEIQPHDFSLRKEIPIQVLQIIKQPHPNYMEHNQTYWFKADAFQKGLEWTYLKGQDKPI